MVTVVVLVETIAVQVQINGHHVVSGWRSGSGLVEALAEFGHA